MRPFAFLTIALVIMACDRPTARPRLAYASAVDSIFPIDEEVRRFKLSYGIDQRNGIEGGATSRDQLVEQFVSALEQKDTALLRALRLDAGDFIHAYYMRSQYARPPYQQGPAFVWFQFEQHTAKGLARALGRFGGKPAGLLGYSCDEQPVLSGGAVLWRNCVISWQLQPSTIRLFGSIIELNGRFKFVSYANDL